MIDERKKIPSAQKMITRSIDVDVDESSNGDPEIDTVKATSLSENNSFIINEDHLNRSTIMPRKVKIFCHDGGIAELVSTMCKSKTSLFKPDAKTSVKPPPSGAASVRILSDGEKSGDVIYIEGTKSDVVSVQMRAFVSIRVRSCCETF